MLVPGLAMLLAGCGPEAEVTPTPVLLKPTATSIPSPAEEPVPPPAETKAGVLIDDFEGGDFDDRWWFYEEGTVSFACTPDQPGHASAQALRLTFEVNADGYANCGLDVDPGRWGDAGGLSFSWRGDRPGLTVIVVLDMKDPTQTNPEAEGVTPFQAELQTPGEEWTPVTLTWAAFTKVEWVGEGGADVLDPTRVVGLYFEVVGEQNGSVWFDDLQLMTGPEVAMPVPTLPPTDTPIPPAATAPPPHAGPVIDKWALWTDGPHLRGANIWQRVVVPDLDGTEFLGSGHVGPPYTQADFDRLAALGANYVNISGPGLFTERLPYVLDEEVQANLDNLLDMIAQADMFAVITARTGPGRSDFTFYRDGAGDWFDESLLIESVWTDQEAQDAWVEMWRYTAERYRDNPIVVGYDLMCEPNSAGILLELWEPDEFYPEYAGTLYDWTQLYPRITAAIREVDPDTPILIGGMGWSAVSWLPSLEPTGDPRTVYIVHQYEPQDDYTHQEPSGQNTYPGEFDLNWDGAPDPFNRDWLEEYLSTIDAFKAEHGMPVAVNEFGVNRWVPGGAAFMDDQMDLFEQRGMNHALWEWQPSWKPLTEENHSMNFRLGPNPDNRADVASSDLMDIIVEYWGRNTIRPSNAVAPSTSAVPLTPSVPTVTSPSTARLAGVSHWLYMINVNLEPEMVERIAASEYDMVVLDFIPSEGNNTDYPMADVIARLHNAPHHFDCAQCKPKLVIAYIDIGQAEDYRTYWQEGWGVGSPEWIAGEDPDGWEGNYPVAYWHDEWREIWLGEGGYLQAILDAGFDGVYLDWVEAYSDENVIAIAQWDGVDPRQEMIWWVGDIADFTRAQRPDFIVIAQNAAELAEDDDYLAIIDAIAQEQIWFDGGAEDDPPGDCPLPRTEAEVDSDAYWQSLSPLCRKQYDKYPDSTLHVSSEEYLHHLTLARDKGELIFTVDYALEPDNVAWVYETSRALGVVPLASNRALDRYVEPVP